MWAPSTLQGRQRLWRRLLAWCHRHSVSLSPDSACLFVTATQVSLQSMYMYTKELSALMTHLGWDTQPLRSMSAALRRQGAAIPLKQATPVPRDTLLHWARLQEPNLQLAVLVAWKTASRWGEVGGLASRQFVLVTSQEVIIDWATSPKGRRGDPYSPSRYVVIVGPCTHTIATLFHELSPFATLTHVSTDALNRMWKGTVEMSPFSPHSIKRGAVTYLMRLGAAGVSVPPELIARLAKHAAPAPLPSTTLRYGADPVALARLLRTAEITRLL